MGRLLACRHAFAEMIERDRHARPLDALGAFDRFLDRFAGDEPAGEAVRPHAVARRDFLRFRLSARVENVALDSAAIISASSWPDAAGARWCARSSGVPHGLARGRAGPR